MDMTEREKTIYVVSKICPLVDWATRLATLTRMEQYSHDPASWNSLLCEGAKLISLAHIEHRQSEDEQHTPA